MSVASVVCDRSQGAWDDCANPVAERSRAVQVGRLRLARRRGAKVRVGPSQRLDRDGPVAAVSATDRPLPDIVATLLIPLSSDGNPINPYSQSP